MTTFIIRAEHVDTGVVAHFDRRPRTAHAARGIPAGAAMTLSRPGRRHSEQRLADVLAAIAEDKPAPHDDGIDHEPDGYSQAEIDRRSDEAADRYEREIERNHP